MKKIFILFIVVFVVTLSMSTASRAGEVSVLLEKLVDKGVLTANEAKIIEQETKAQVSKEVAQKNSYALPDWVQSIKIKGDIRLRYQYEKTEAAVGSRNRGRTRFRMGMEMTPVKSTKVMAGFSSGGTDPRSTNVTWENTFERPDLRLDYAAVEYEAAPWAKLVGGKFIFSDYLWQSTDMLWDTDINPYGFSAHLNHAIVSDWEGFFNGGVWILDENGVSKHPDPSLIYLQGGAAYQNDKFDAKVAETWYVFNGVKGYSLDNSANTNTRSAGVLQYDYDAMATSLEIAAKNLFGGLPFSIDERMAVFGDYIINPDPKQQNKGWSSGIVFGHSKVSDRKQWQMKYQYVALGTDAFPDTFPDSDRFGGRTDVKSHEAIFTYGLLKNVSVGVDYYVSNRIKAAHNRESIVQADLNIKF